jgi:hypothetical protein
MSTCTTSAPGWWRCMWASSADGLHRRVSNQGKKMNSLWSVRLVCAMAIGAQDARRAPRRSVGRQAVGQRIAAQQRRGHPAGRSPRHSGLQCRSPPRQPGTGRSGPPAPLGCHARGAGRWSGPGLAGFFAGLGRGLRPVHDARLVCDGGVCRGPLGHGAPRTSSGRALGAGVPEREFERQFPVRPRHPTRLQLAERGQRRFGPSVGIRLHRADDRHRLEWFAALEHSRGLDVDGFSRPPRPSWACRPPGTAPTSPACAP